MRSTSKAALSSVDNFRSQHYAAILSALNAGPAVVDEIARRSNLKTQQVNKRVVELQRTGRLAVTGRQLRSDSGRLSREWAIPGGGA